MRTVRVYSRAKEGSVKVGPNFTVSEFACADGAEPVLIDPELVEVLQSIRDHFGKAVIVNSGYRTPAHNKAVGGAARSQHLYGTAADITVRGVHPLTVAGYAEQLLPGKGGIGISPGFVHIDVRETRQRWR